MTYENWGGVFYIQPKNCENGGKFIWNQDVIANITNLNWRRTVRIFFSFLFVHYWPVILRLQTSGDFIIAHLYKMLNCSDLYTVFLWILKKLMYYLFSFFVLWLISFISFLILVNALNKLQSKAETLNMKMCLFMVLRSFSLIWIRHYLF